jgi:hypothetical protein
MCLTYKTSEQISMKFATGSLHQKLAGKFNFALQKLI